MISVVLRLALAGLAGGVPMAVSFAGDIRPLFRDSPDIDSMKDYGLDLSSYENVKAQAGEIYARLAVACPVTTHGRWSRLGCSNDGWTKAWRPKTVSLKSQSGSVRSVRDDGGTDGGCWRDAVCSASRGERFHAVCAALAVGSNIPQTRKARWRGRLVETMRWVHFAA